MEQEVTNFARFWTAFNRMDIVGDREDVRHELVAQCTLGRTSSLKEVTRSEYETLCSTIEKVTGMVDERKKKRSKCLSQMQKLGIDTSDWTRINAFCKDARIAGKEFSRLTIEDLDALSLKLRAISRNGGLKAKKEVAPPAEQQVVTYILKAKSNELMC